MEAISDNNVDVNYERSLRVSNYYVILRTPELLYTLKKISFNLELWLVVALFHTRPTSPIELLHWVPMMLVKTTANLKKNFQNKMHFILLSEQSFYK